MARELDPAEAADAADYAVLAAALERHAGLRSGEYKVRCLRRRLQVRMRAVGALTWGDYARYLEERPEEVAELRDTLSVSVTRFYRNAAVWDQLRAQWLPRLAAARRRPLTAWSAGCATGEEAYTLAMLLHEAMTEAGTPGVPVVDATDIDADGLAATTAAHYRPEAFQELPAALRERWSREVPGGREVEPLLRAAVRARRLDLLGPEAAHGPVADVVSCRNVLIYFDRAAQDRVLRALHARLAPEGLLVLGQAETLLGETRTLFAPVDVRARVYRRTA